MHLDQDTLHVCGFRVGEKETVVISMMPPRSWILQLDPAAGSLEMQRDDICFCLLEFWGVSSSWGIAVVCRQVIRRL